VNLTETSVKQGIEAAGDRPMLILHGDIDQRLDYQSSVDFLNYAKEQGADISLETFTGSDHTEGMLSESQRYADLLAGFFDRALTK
jgi:dipeptidyl aminopeptidase/acylaminoacyl peptidase